MFAEHRMFAKPSLFVWSAFAVAACNRPTESDTDVEPTVNPNPVVIYFTADTLGMAAARGTGWCERLGEITAEYGLDVGCLEGGLSPSSWTGESHTRFLWPQHMTGAMRGARSPKCDQTSVLGLIKKDRGGSFVFGSDNPVIGPGQEGAEPHDPCESTGELSWHADTDVHYETTDRIVDMNDDPEDGRPTHLAITDFLTQVQTGEPVVAFFVAMEVGGHFPRCYYDPYTESCEGLWSLAVEAGLTEADADRETTFKDFNFQNSLINYATTQLSDRELEIRPHFWGAMEEAILHHRPALFEDRLERILTGLEDAGRLDDLTMVIMGDHGENPCVKDPFSPGLNCTHGRITTEWTGMVPAFTIPASVGEDWKAAGYVGDASNVWSTANLAYGMLDTIGVQRPSYWPEPWEIGSAASWACSEMDGVTSKAGVVVVGNESLRCSNGTCGAWDWSIPDSPTMQTTELDAIPAALEEHQDWLLSACDEITN